jgi:hypothetical protein
MKPLALCALLVLAAACGPAYHSRDLAGLHQVQDRDDVIAAANRLFICTDNKDWACVRDVFAPQVLFDMTSMTGGKPETRTPREIAALWEQGLKSVKAIHHQGGNYEVTVRGDEADLFCYGIAYHYLPNPTERNTRIFVGSYNEHFVRSGAGWKMDRFKYNLKFIDGNKDLEGAAKQ